MQEHNIFRFLTHCIGLLCIFTILLLSGCSSTSQKSFDTANLTDLQNLNQQDTNAMKPTVGKIRLQALKETAMSIGAQGSLYKRATQIDGMLSMNSKMLSTIFNFNGLLLDHNVLPPVLTESDQSLKLANPDLIQAADHTYSIVKQAHFVTTAPTWRDYLFMNYAKPELPDATLLPKNKQERKIWIKYVNIGWQNGINQADNIYATNLAIIQRDLKGMMLYRQLLDQHMVSKPYVATTNMGIASNEDHTEMQINRRMLRITSTPRLIPNAQQWKPVVVQAQ